MPNVISHHHQLEQSISVLRDIRWYFLILIQILIENYASKQRRPRSDTVLGLTNPDVNLKRMHQLYDDLSYVGL